MSPTPQTLPNPPQTERREFFTQSEEALDSFEQDLIRLEALASPEPATLNRLLNTLATLEVEAENFAFTELLASLRQGRGLLENISSGTLAVSIATMNTLFQLSDHSKKLLKQYQLGDVPTPALATVIAAPVPIAEAVLQEEPVAVPAAEEVVEVIEVTAPAGVEAAEPEDEIVEALSAQAFYRDGSLVIEVAGQALTPQAFSQASLTTSRAGFSLSLPLNTPPVQALLVTVADKTLAIPVEHVVEVQRLNQADIHRNTVTLRGQKLPLLDVGTVVDIPPATRAYLVVVQDGTTTFALAIDQWLEPEEITFHNGAATTATGQDLLFVDVAALRRAAQS